MWAGSIDAYLSGRFEEWLAEADGSNDADLLYRDATMEPVRSHIPLDG